MNDTSKTPGGVGKHAAPPSFAELKRRAERLIPVLRERAQDAETLRRLPDATIADLHDAGLFRLHQPARVGGSELPFRAIVELGAIIARGCASTAWVLTNLACHHWMLGYFAPAAQDEIWGGSPDALVGSAFVFACGRAHRVEGGYRLSGRWPFSSGVDAAQWNLIGALVGGAAPSAPEHRMFLVPRRDYRVLDTWHVMGLIGTGSQDVAVDDVFVPEHRTLAMAVTTGETSPGNAVNPSALYRLPMLALFSYIVGAVPLGIAQGAVEQYVAATRSKTGTYTGKSLAELATMQMHVAEASALTEAAEALMLRGCDEAMLTAEAGGAATMAQKARWRRDGAYAARMCTEAVDILFTAAGGGAIYHRNPLQRAFRDIHAAVGHYAANWDVAGTLYGRVALGLPADTPNF